MHAGGEHIHTSPLSSGIIDTNFGVGDTAVEARLGVRLPLNLPVPPKRTCMTLNVGKHLLSGKLIRHKFSSRVFRKKPDRAANTYVCPFCLCSSIRQKNRGGFSVRNSS